MSELLDGASVEIQGSAARPYVLKNVGGVYSCSCPAWRNQSLPIDQRSCKHLRAYRGEEAEQERLGQTAFTPAKPTTRSLSMPKAPALLLAETWSEDQDPADWLISEKLDGVRALWDGKQFCSRQGNRIYAPAWFTKDLPKIPLDGELWMARKCFQKTVGIVRRQDESLLWQSLKFVVFDAPGSSEPFESRLKLIRDVLGLGKLRFAAALPHYLCCGRDHLKQELDRIIELGGEGVMLRQPGSLYVAGRSDTLLKCKRFHDGEAEVVGYQAGRGRHRGRLGALVVALADGTRFCVGTGFTDAQRSKPPTIGSTITFRNQELTDGGVPRFPSFVRVRTDVTAQAG